MAERRLTPQDFGLVGEPSRWDTSDGKVQMLYMQPDSAGYGRAVAKDAYEMGGVVPERAQNAQLYLDYLAQQAADTPPSPQRYGEKVAGDNEPPARVLYGQYAEANMLAGKEPSPYKFIDVPDWQVEEQRMGKPFMQTYESARSQGLPKDQAWAMAMQAREADQKQQETVAKMNARVWEVNKMYPDDRFGPDGKAAGQAKPYFQFAGIDPNTGERMIFDARTGDITAATTSKGALDPKVTPKPSASERTAVSNLMTLQDKVNRINEIYDPAFTGIIQGQVGRLTKLGNPTEVEFREYVDSLKDDLLRAKSGAQINEQEYRRLTGFLPNYNLTDTNFRASIKRFNDELGMIMKNKSKVFNQSGVKNPIAPSGKKISRFTVEVQ